MNSAGKEKAQQLTATGAYPRTRRKGIERGSVKEQEGEATRHGSKAPEQ